MTTVINLMSFSIIGEDKTLSIKVGAEAGDPSTQDIILIRGPSSDVDRAVKRIHQIIEDAKNDEIVNSYVRAHRPVALFCFDLSFQYTEFDIDKEYVGRIVGAHGAGINKLREQLGVKVDVSDDVDDKEIVVGKRKKIVHQKSKIKVRYDCCACCKDYKLTSTQITGRKENVEDAKKRIFTQIERLVSCQQILKHTFANTIALLFIYK